MKLKLLTLGLMLATMAATAQTPRLSLFEEFTGENCPPCASTNPGLNSLLSSPTNTPKCVSIKWQVPIPSAPSNTWSLYRTDKTEIDWRYKAASAGYGYPSQWTSTTTATSGINAAPTGLFDGQHQWMFGAASDHPAYVTNAVIASAQSYTSAFSVSMQKAWDQTMSSVNVTVNITASANFAAVGSLIFRTVMIEKLIQFTVAPGTNGEKNFENTVIASFPSIQLGTPIAGTWVVGQTQTFTLNCPVPSYARNINQIDMVGFIQDDGNKQVAQAVRASECSMSNITVSTPHPFICLGKSATISAGGANSYAWSDTTQTGSFIIVSPTVTTNYWVMSTDANACTNIAAITVSVTDCTGLQELAGNNNYPVNIYPNPNRGDFMIKADFANEKTKIVVYNAVGQKVFEQTLNAGETAIKTNLAKGLYNYQVLQSSQKINTGKLLVE